MSEEVSHTRSMGIKLDPTVNYGHLITMTTMLLTAVVAWTNLSNRQEEANRRIINLERSSERMTADNAAEARVVARLEEKITSLDRVLLRIERILEAEVNRRGDAPSYPSNRNGG